MTETEIKSLIDKETYDRAAAAFDWDEVTEQTNYYYTDRAGILREKRVTVRVRENENSIKLQVKHHRNSGGSLQVCEENEFEAEEAPDIIDADEARRVTGMDVGELYKMGSATTLRMVKRRGGTELCLDKTTYFDITDYEAELEYTDKMSADLLMKLTTLGITFNKQCVGKFTRFLAEYEKRGGR